MVASTRFAVAVHILVLLSESQGAPVTSGLMAGSVGTNEVVVRRLLGPLRRAGCVESRPGAGGGWVLAREPSAVTLAQVWQTVEEGTDLVSRHGAPNPACPVGRNIQAALDEVSQAAQAAWLESLGSRTVADLVDGVRRAEGRRA